MDEINKLESELNNNLSIQDINKYLEKVIKLKRKNINNNSEYKLLSHIQEYLEYKLNKKNHQNISLLSFVNTLFLPFGIIVGYFGMNFKSLGNPALNKGILKDYDAFQLVGVLFFLSFIVSLYIFKVPYGIA